MQGSQFRFGETHQAHITIVGYVQGVGFRQFVKAEAVRLGVKGWVKNTQQGTVEAVLIGHKNQIALVLETVKQGPMLATVENVAVVWEKVTTIPPSFVILR